MIKNWKSKIYFLFIFFLFIFFWFSTVQVKAQEISLGIWPPLLEVIIQPGKTITHIYQLTNNSKRDLLIKSQIVPFVPQDEKGNVYLLTPPFEEKTNQTLTWFSFQNADLKLGEQFLLPAKREQQVVLKIKVPQNAQEDDYYFTLLFETQEIPGEYFDQNQNTSQITAKIGANILLTVSQTGNPPKKAQIERFSLVNPQFTLGKNIFLDSFSAPQFEVVLTNTGQTLFKPQGKIEVNGWFRQKWQLNLLPENVLTKGKRKINCGVLTVNQENQTNFLPSNCQLPGKFFLGKYKAVLVFGLEETTSNTYQQEIIFWVLPFKLVFGLLTILFLFLIINKKQIVLK